MRSILRAEYGSRSITKAKKICFLLSFSFFPIQIMYRYKPWEESLPMNSRWSLTLITADKFTETYFCGVRLNFLAMWTSASGLCRWACWHASSEQVASKPSATLCLCQHVGSVAIGKWVRGGRLRETYFVIQPQSWYQTTSHMSFKTAMEIVFLFCGPTFLVAAYLPTPHIILIATLSAPASLFFKKILGCLISGEQIALKWAIKAAPSLRESFISFRIMSLFTIFIMFLWLMIWETQCLNVEVGIEIFKQMG